MVPVDRHHLDCYTVPDWWPWDCEGGMRQVLRYFTCNPINHTNGSTATICVIGWITCKMGLPKFTMDSGHVRMNSCRILKSLAQHWRQANCMPSVLCKETVKYSRWHQSFAISHKMPTGRYHWQCGNAVWLKRIFQIVVSRRYVGMNLWFDVQVLLCPWMTTITKAEW